MVSQNYSFYDRAVDCKVLEGAPKLNRMATKQLVAAILASVKPPQNIPDDGFMGPSSGVSQVVFKEVTEGWRPNVM